MINWVLQKNLTKPQILSRIKSAVEKDNTLWEEIQVIPFSTQLPILKNQAEINIPYGSTTFMINASKNQLYDKGIFYDPAKFKMQNYVSNWGKHMLNHSGHLANFGDLNKLNFKEDELLFIRPNNDGKEFSGRILTYKKLLTWSIEVCKLDTIELNKSTKIWISIPKEIEKEWRIFIVDNEVISASRYMYNGQLNESEKDIPDEMLEFVNSRIQEYRLDDVYVMDVAKSENEYKIIECNCFNGTGFYKNDIEKIVTSINSFLKRKTSRNNL